ncbi:MAG: PaaI family thioesterase [Nitrososphaerota archaeon]|nr:PaaI family thioesterase [Nitrososphaerota archaeon]MDG6938122.1 PaaI family thioesterase [Nitrososphaerota archaeon]MDG6959255.1 PaaI family thioesterase [Nitrososphaerota archaeon]MDG6965265.1 PaaI family thioesterase [Nitrososphaerota archaeon]MDG6969104.1 PaaI family thioesterase [Nitrososphaerota archaeon]
MVDYLQDTYAPNGVCFGCGPKNELGLRLKSAPSGESVVADWTPRKEHTAFEGYGSGGIISVLMDCHGNWAAAYALMKARMLPAPPGTVTAEYTVRFLKPSPIDKPWHLAARATKVEGDRAYVSGELEVGGAVTATMTGLFVAVREGHPAFGRWR